VQYSEEKVILNNGSYMPSIGFGTSLIEGKECILNVKQALEAGYRHIDTASAYENESYIGEAIKESNIPREEIFITSKVWKDSMGYEKTIESFNKSLQNLGLDYIDLYLIHWPRNNDKNLNIETWRALEDLYKQGKVKAIGVSNFLKHHLDIILDNCEIVPMVDQLEIHPGLTRKETVKFCKENNIVVEAWAPLGKGKMLQNEKLVEIAEKYNKSVAQICIKWCLQNGIVPLPKTTNWNRMLENKDVFDFLILDEDIDFINSMSFFAGSDMDPNKS
jgi:diketogulonate reductase-like aldo/keto reductase